MTSGAEGVIASLGEALIDVVETGDDEPRLARPGGGPYNIAIGLARLGRPTAFIGRLSHDPLGLILRRHAERSDVDLSHTVNAHETTTVALVELVDGIAQYRFGIEGTANFLWTDAELASVPTTLAALHFGSLVAWTPPGDDAVLARVAALREHMLVSYDPNVRPLLQTDRVAARAKVEAGIALAHVVKTSEEDVAWLHPGDDPVEVTRSWLELGPTMVVLTRGSEGAVAQTRRHTVARPTRPTTVVDTVGAGDAFMSGLLDAMAEDGLLDAAALADAPPDAIGRVLDHAALVAAVTCSRAGANPPRREDLAAFR